MERVKQFVTYLLLGLVGFTAIFPYLWILWTSIKPADLAYRPTEFSFTPTLSAYQEVIIQKEFYLAIFNSLFIGVVTTAITIIVSILAAYAFVRYFTGEVGQLTQYAYLSGFLLPPIILVIPMFFLFDLVGLLNSRIAIIFSHLTFTIPIGTWFLSQFLRDVPIELEEAAIIDGDTRIEALFFILVPSMKKGIISVGFIVFIYSWNNFMYPLILAGSRDSRTLPVALVEFDTVQGVLISEMTAAIVVTVLPVVVLIIYANQYIVEGLSVNSGID